MTAQFTKHSNRMKHADRLIRLKATGSPKEFAKRLNISESHLYNVLDELRLLGTPLSYDKIRLSYFYTRPVQLRIEIAIIPLSEDEQQAIEGGIKIMLNLLHSTFFRVETPIFAAQ